jgi:serine/threonine-protein kinase RsbW
MNTESHTAQVNAFAWCRSFPPVAESVPEVRRGARLVLRAWGVPDDPTAAVLLIVSELTTNAVRHARVPGRGVDVFLGHDDRAVEVEVFDGSRHRPVVRGYDPDATSGRGLLLVAGLADEWEVREQPSGKSVWARVVTPSR